MSNQTQTIKATDRLAGLFKALSHPIRLEIMQMLLARGECISGDIADQFDKAPSTVSEHLKILKEAGLISGSIDGPKRCYCVNLKAISELKQLLDGYLPEADFKTISCED